MERGSAVVNYLVLLLVILVGVAGGNLISGWVSAEIEAYRAEQAGARKSGRTSQESTISKIPMPGDFVRMQQEHAREQRRRDRDGVRLSQACEEWRQANAQMNSATTGAEMKKHCGIYERYVQDGVLPAKR